MGDISGLYELWSKLLVSPFMTPRLSGLGFRVKVYRFRV